jgi:UDP-N-acetylglucosamine 2-epimerase
LQYEGCERRQHREAIALQMHGAAVMTNSGSMQKEAVTLGASCVTLRNEIECPESLEEDWNVPARSDSDPIIEAMRKHLCAFRAETSCAS